MRFVHFVKPLESNPVLFSSDLGASAWHWTEANGKSELSSVRAPHLHRYEISYCAFTLGQPRNRQKRPVDY